MDLISLPSMTILLEAFQEKIFKTSLAIGGNNFDFSA